MGSGDWLKKIVGLKKLKNGKPKYLKGSSVPQYTNRSNKNDQFQLKSTNSHHVPDGDAGISVEDLAATRIQSAFRAYSARKTRRQLKGTVKIRAVTLGSSSRKQASVTLKYLHTWSRLQTEIRTRRNSMAVEARIRQRKLENQLKLETKLHELEVEWSNGPETMEEVLSRIHLREEAAVKRERAMAYAFSHQLVADFDALLSLSPRCADEAVVTRLQSEIDALKEQKSHVDDQLVEVKDKNRDLLQEIETLKQQVVDLSTDKRALNALVVSYQSIESGLNATVAKLKTDHATALVDVLESKRNLEGELLDAREALDKSNSEAVKALEAGFAFCRDRAIKAGYDMTDHTFQRHCEDLARLRDEAGSSTRPTQSRP